MKKLQKLLVFSKKLRKSIMNNRGIDTKVISFLKKTTKKAL